MKISIEKEEGSVVSFVGWQRLMPYLAQAIGKQLNETITHLVIEEGGINVYVRTKPQKLTSKQKEKKETEDWLKSRSYHE